jgi:hypothetical protein
MSTDPLGRLRMLAVIRKAIQLSHLDRYIEGGTNQITRVVSDIRNATGVTW